jgi:hypothetical protein
MSNVASIVELMETTRLAPLDAADRRKFLARYAAELKEACPGRRQGNDIRRCVGRHALSQAAPYRARARHSANAIERLCLQICRVTRYRS